MDESELAAFRKHEEDFSRVYKNSWQRVFAKNIPESSINMVNFSLLNKNKEEANAPEEKESPLKRAKSEMQDTYSDVASLTSQ